jgi:hypothetical protein
MIDKFYVSGGVWYPVREQVTGPILASGAHTHIDPRDARIAELEAENRELREALEVIAIEPADPSDGYDHARADRVLARNALKRAREG